MQSKLLGALHALIKIYIEIAKFQDNNMYFFNESKALDYVSSTQFRCPEAISVDKNINS